MKVDKVKQKYNRFGLLSCYFSNGLRCTYHCDEWCPAADKISDYEQKTKELNELEQEIDILKLEMNKMEGEIHEIYKQMVSEA